METIIEASEIRKKYKALTALNGIDFQVFKGECFGLLDPNGAGKTTMVRMLYNFVSKDGGKLRELKKAGTTLVLTTHYMEEAAQLCDRLIILDKGSILVEGKPMELVRDFTLLVVIPLPFGIISYFRLKDRITH